MTKIKAFKRIKKKKISGTQQFVPQNFLHVGENGDESVSEKKEVQKAEKLRRGRGFDTLQ